ncbi:hypothetical protein [Brasilonema sp. UFV-L1]|uniref:hypothetical protein n=1 Tax=Brasilonema sp. UFV-L1 TaxID=2234130 RepID=UPI00145F3311|nr:hypothetical protein [Brasilonema sp. UFV-L1]NMG10441.1 hypothetical protein [Brasilonema sp. UFV-L1]
MSEFQKSMSERCQALLQQYPQWLVRVQSALEKSPVRLENLPLSIEIFDQSGLLLGVLLGETVYSGASTLGVKSEFLAWLYDGELVVFTIDKEVIVNRIIPEISTK